MSVISKEKKRKEKKRKERMNFDVYECLKRREINEERKERGGRILRKGRESEWNER